MDHPYKDFLHRLERPARYVGGEFRSVVKPDAEIRIALAFPDLYEIGMSHLGFKILYGILNRAPGIAAERVFAPWTDLEGELRAQNLPLVSLESGRPLSEFDVVGFSLQYEMTYTNVLNMLELGGIPLRSAERGERAPLVAAGGPCAMSPEPMAPFIDLFVIGDGEESAVELLRAWKKLREAGASRREALERLARVEGCYVPACYEAETDPRTGLQVVTGSPAGAPLPVSRRVIPDLKAYPFPHDSPVPFTEVVFDRMAIELARGCTEGCRFCQAGTIYRPVRERDPVEVIGTIVNGLRCGGYEEASLTALSTADYSCISPLLKALLPELKRRNVKLGVSSLRAYGLGEDLLDEMAGGNVTGLTFAPEAGTQRLRDVISKNVTEEEMLRTAERVFGRGWHRIKLYFMIGLPTETEEDVVGIVETARRVSDAGRRANPGRRSEVTVSVSPHVPKPHTPFQWAGMESAEGMERKLALLARLARKYRLPFRKHDARVSRVEALLSRGDRRLGYAIETAFRKGCRFDGWEERFKFEPWIESLRECGLKEGTYLSPLPVGGRLPWSHIDTGVEADFLAREYRRALEGRPSPPCGKPAGLKAHHPNLAEHEADERKLVCSRCGIACDLSGMKAQRGAYLRAAGARVPEPREEASRVKTRREAGPAPAGPRHPVRLTYAKLPPASYVSHLDTVRMLQRHFRRAGIEIAPTGGFNPRPDMTFGPALPLGVPSVGERVDALLREAFGPEELLRLLNLAADPGVRYLAAHALQPLDLPLPRGIVAAEYAVRLPAEGVFGELAARLRAREAVTVERRRNGKERSFDLRREILWVAPLAAEELPTELAGCIESPALRLRLAVRADGSVRPGEALRGFFGEQAALWPVARLRLLEAADARPVPAEPLPGALSEAPAACGP